MTRRILFALAGALLFSGCPSASSGGSRTVPPPPPPPMVSRSEAPIDPTLASAASVDATPAEQPPANPAHQGCHCREGEICMRQHGHPGPTRAGEPPPAFTCVPRTHPCPGPDKCQCIKGQMRCWRSTEVPHACECDNGMR